MNRQSGLLAVSALSLGLAFGAQAQVSSGNLQGEAVAGDTIVVDGVGTGYHRELKVEKDGKFSIRRIPTGEYVVTKSHADGTTEQPQPVAIHAGVTVRVK